MNVRLGVSYYPEQWPEALWEDDFRRMREMGMGVVRMGEFAWSIFEPEEGVFEFGMFDRAMDLAHHHGLEVVLGTPTSTPPAWLTFKYPETLNRTREGLQFQHGMRGHVNHTAPALLRLSERIAGKLAEHYGSHPALIGWQIDNELNCEINAFYAESDHDAFRIWLQARHRSLDDLNRAWGTVVWSQTYSDWSQVHLTRLTPSDSPNPHQALDEKRFFSEATIRFAKAQAEAIRRFDRRSFVTTNGLFKHVDSHRLTEECLDFISFDSYPQFANESTDKDERKLLDRRWGFLLSEVRGISSNFYVVEQQSGAGGWTNRMQQAAPKPGQMRLWAYQSIAHGADALVFFRWRTAPFGNEIYWQGINDTHNQPNWRCSEAAQIGQEVQKLAGLVGSPFQANVAILRSYDNLWDGELDTWHGPYEKQSVLGWYTALQHRHIPCDVKYLAESTTINDLSRYKLLIYPHPAILTEVQAELLRLYAAEGGIVVFGCRSGYKDDFGHARMQPCPGPIADLCGASVAEFTRVDPNEPEVKLRGGEFAGLFAGSFNDVLRVNSGEVEVLATYGEGAGHYQREPALIAHPWKSGKAVTFGGVFTEATALAVLEALDIRSPLASELSLTPGIELAIRGPYTFLLNYSRETIRFEARVPFRDCLTEEAIFGPAEISPYGVRVLGVSGRSNNH